MRTLHDVKRWYASTKQLLRMMHRIGDKYWAKLPWDDMGMDERFKAVEGFDITRDATLVLDEFDDLAVFVMFSVFEANLRDFVVRDMGQEADAVTHFALRQAVDRAIVNVEEGSLYRNVLSFWSKSYPDETEMVNQIRRYRNWVAHGCRPDRKPPAAVEPVGALAEAPTVPRRHRILPPA